MNTGARRLVLIRAFHTLVWAFFAGSIVAIAPLAWRGEFRAAGVLIAVVFAEVLVIGLNRGRCPLTAVAARYTEDRRDNFDIYLPQWLARHNQRLFGGLYAGAVVLTAVLWSLRPP
ncbi:MAG TPA: hypothetical protein VMU00_07695 [Steroidobacteraceae bacterium]|nr:hypothetical protein [Steroidobacteraceae bacterium]